MNTTLNTIPWYRQFWPWFIIGLPATSVVAGITTVFIAFNNADSLVNDNYYRDGLAINQRLAQDTRATELQLNANITFDKVSGEVLTTLTGKIQSPDALELLLLHPGNHELDNTVLLTHISGGRYRADIEALPSQRFYLRLQTHGDNAWRLNGEIDLANLNSTVLRHNQ